MTLVSGAGLPRQPDPSGDHLGPDGPDHLRRRPHELAVLHRRGVDRDLVGARLQEPAHVFKPTHPTAHGKRHEAALGGSADHVEDGVAVLMARGDVEKAELVGATQIIGGSHLDGIARIAATPHVRADYPTSPDTMERGVDVLNRAAREAGVPIEVLRGGELDLEYAARLDDATLARFGLGGNAAVLLLECPYSGWPLDLRDFVFRLGARGFSVVLAHPERNPDVQADPELLRPLVDAGVLVQLTAASVDEDSPV